MRMTMLLGVLLLCPALPGPWLSIFGLTWVRFLVCRFAMTRGALSSNMVLPASHVGSDADVFEIFNQSFVLRKHKRPDGSGNCCRRSSLQRNLSNQDPKVARPVSLDIIFGITQFSLQQEEKKKKRKFI